jgi:hypothetical protein
MLINIPIKIHDSRSNKFLSYMRYKLKIANFYFIKANNSKILNKTTQKYQGAQQHMLINIPVKFHDSRSNTFWFTCDTKENGRTDGRTRVNLNASHLSGGTKTWNAPYVSTIIPLTGLPLLLVIGLKQGYLLR